MRKLIKILLALFMTTFAVSSFAIEKNQTFAATDGCRFILNGKTYSFIGANFCTEPYLVLKVKEETVTV